jgi:hypothetical protein
LGKRQACHFPQLFATREYCRFDEDFLWERKFKWPAGIVVISPFLFSYDDLNEEHQPNGNPENQPL